MTFTCPFRPFAFKRISFGLCRHPPPFLEMHNGYFFIIIGDSLEVFVDDLSTFRDDFESYLPYLMKILSFMSRYN